MRADKTAVYVGGSFTRFAGRPHPALAALAARNGAVLDWRIRINDAPSSEPASVIALGLGSGRLYAASASFVDGLAPVLGRARDPELQRVRLLAGGFVDDILVSHGIVFVGGHEGRPAFSAQTGRALPRLRGIEGSVFAATGKLVYLGGNLRDTAPGNNLAALDVGTGRLTSWRPQLAKFVFVGTISASGSKVLVAGSFCRSIG